MPKLNNSESGKKNGLIKKHRGAAKPRKVVDGNLLTTQQIAKIVTDFIPAPPPPPKLPAITFPDADSWAREEMKYRQREMDRVVGEEEDRIERTAANPNAMVSLYERKIYLNCGHRVPSFINTIKLNSFYYCDLCCLYKKIQEVVY